MKIIDLLENGNLGLTIFDIDETLFRTTAQIKVVKDGQVVRSLTNQEFNNYELQPGEDFDFGEFKDAEKFSRESIPIEPMIAKLKAILQNAGDSKVIMLTARSDFDNKDMFLDTFRRYGIDIDRIHVHRAGNLGGAPAENKEVFIRKYLDTGDYARVRLYDDSMSNIRMFNALSKEYPDIKFFPYFVTHEGGIKTIREGVGRIVKGVNTTVDVGPNEIKTQAAKFGNTVDRDGRPPTMSSKVKGKSTNVLFNLGLTEGIKLRLERDADIDVLHIIDTKKQNRIEVRGKKGYETNGYDPKDKLHQVLDKVGKAANISDLMNGEVVSIHPGHPQGKQAIKTAQDVLKTEGRLSIFQSLIETETHTVQQGDTLYGLSTQYGVSVEDLQSWNELDGTNIRLGQELYVSEPEPFDPRTMRPRVRPASFFNSYERLLIRVARAAGIEGRELAQLLAQSAHETRNFSRWIESGSRDYFNRYEFSDNLGNTEPGDGFKYRGRGYLQLTGRYNYQQASDALGMDFIEMPDLAERPYIAAQIAIWYWNWRVRRLASDPTNTREVTRIIQGRSGGLESRERYFASYINQMPLIDQEAGDFREIESIEEGWSNKYKRSINCNNPKGFSQKAHCAGRKKNESISGDEMLSTFQRIHHDSGMNPSMDKWVKSQEWGIDTISPNDIVEFEDLFDYDDPFDRIIDVDESQVRKYITAIKAGRQLDPIILGPQHKDGKYSIVDGNHRALAYAALGKDIPVYMPMGNIDENFADGKKKGKSRPGRVKRAGASCKGSVTSLRKRAKDASGEKSKMYHWCANMKSGRKKK